ncbi:MAG: LysR family transcriptional regulator [Devosia sp.]|nr:LysR family transcriptional regulator [Devosia sp.]
MDERNRTRLDWEDVRVFVALARRGSLSGAARSLGVNHATVARRIASLEAAAGGACFERRPGGYALTDRGKRILDAAAAMEDAAGRLTAAAGAEEHPALRGIVRLSATPSIAESFVIPQLGSLQRAHPGLDIELVADRRLVSLSRHEADLALRLGRPADSTLVGRKLASLAFGLYAAPEVAAAHAARPELAPFISFDDSGSALPEAVWLREALPDARIAFRANGQMAQAAAARVGLGIAPLPHFLAAEDPGLVRVPFPSAPPPRELWLLSRPNSDRVERVRVVKIWLVELFDATRRRF